MIWLVYLPAVFLFTFVVVWGPVQLTLTAILLLIVIGVISLPCAATVRPRVYAKRALLIGLGIAVLFLSVIWSFAPDRSFEKALQISLLVLGASVTMLLVSENRALPTRWLPAVFWATLLLSGVLVLFEHSTAMGIEGSFRTLEFGEAFAALNQSATLLSIFVFYGALGLYLWLADTKVSGAGLRVAVILFAGLTVFAASRPPADAVSLALIVGAAVFFISAKLPRLPAFLPGVLFLVGGLVYPLVHPQILADEHFLALFSDARASVLHRIVVWDYVSESIGINPWLGWGLDAARALPGNDQDALDWLRAAVPDGAFSQAVKLDGFPVMPLHPHNAPLQVRLELGVLGTVVISYLLFRVGMRIAQTEDRRLRMVRIATFNAFIIATFLSFSLWQTWIFAAAIVVVLVDWAICREMRRSQPIVDNRHWKEGGHGRAD